MKQNLLLTLILLTVLALPAIAMQHESHDMAGHDMQQGQNNGSMAHDGMNTSGEMVMLGDTQTVDGMEAMAHIKDVREAMAKMKMPVTHHFMLMIKDQHGNNIDSGTVAVKIKGPDGSISAPVKLMGMGGHFGADIELQEKGMYSFIVGSKLADGVKRNFEFTYHMN